MPLKLTVSNGDIAQVVNPFGGFYKDPNLENPYQDNEWDAYRHIYSSAAYTEKFGSSIAQFLGNLNEIFPVSKWGKSHDSAYYKRENMDYWNNKVGRTEYQKWKDAKDLGDTEKSLEKWLYDVVKEGKTINDLSDTRKWSYPYIDIFEEQLTDNMNWFNSQ